MSTSKPKFPWQYVCLAYGLTWIFWIPVALTRQDYQGSPVLLALMFLGVAGPGLAGVLLTTRELGKEGGRDFWRRVFDFRRISLKWAALILLLFPALYLLAIAVNAWLGGDPPQFAFVREALAVPAGITLIVILYLLQAGLEELGWRGYMLDRLQAAWKPLKASLVLGVVHTFWHLPLFFMVGTNQSRYASPAAFGMFIVFVLAGSIYSTWCYNDNQRSILAVILLHTVANLSLDAFMLPGIGEILSKALVGLGALGIVLAWMLSANRTKQAASI